MSVLVTGVAFGFVHHVVLEKKGVGKMVVGNGVGQRERERELCAVVRWDGRFGVTSI
jgi:hypothetical protein